MRFLLKGLMVPTVLLLAAADWRATVPRSPTPLRGAWKLIQSSLTTGEKTTTNSSPQPGLVLFTDRHYSLMYVEGSAPRVPFADPNPSRATDAEKLAAFDTFSGHSGSYSVSDSLVEMQVIVSKWPILWSPTCAPLLRVSHSAWPAIRCGSPGAAPVQSLG